MGLRNNGTEDVYKPLAVNGWPTRRWRQHACAGPGWRQADPAPTDSGPARRLRLPRDLRAIAPRCRGRYEVEDSGEGEGEDQPVLERAEHQAGEELLTRQHGDALR